MNQLVGDQGARQTRLRVRRRQQRPRSGRAPSRPPTTTRSSWTARCPRWTATRPPTTIRRSQGDGHTPDHRDDRGRDGRRPRDVPGRGDGRLHRQAGPRRRRRRGPPPLDRPRRTRPRRGSGKPEDATGRAPDCPDPLDGSHSRSCSASTTATGATLRRGGRPSTSAEPLQGGPSCGGWSATGDRERRRSAPRTASRARAPTSAPTVWRTSAPSWRRLGPGRRSGRRRSRSWTRRRRVRAGPRRPRRRGACTA